MDECDNCGESCVGSWDEIAEEWLCAECFGYATELA